MKKTKGLGLLKFSGGKQILEKKWRKRMKNYRDIFLALVITLQDINFANLPKVSKHWNKEYNKKRSGVYMASHRKNAHVW